MAGRLSQIRDLPLPPPALPPAREALSRLDLFAGLPERDLGLLESRLPLIHWQRGALIPEPLTRSDHIFVVRSGRLALFERTALGHEIMIALLEVGAIYSTLGGVPLPGVAALEDSSVSALSGRALESLTARYPKLGGNLAALLSERMAMLRETVALVSEMRVEDRLRARLHQLADRFGIAATAGVRLSLDLTHAQWASLVGASREAVTTAFGKLKAQNAIVMQGRSITIPWEVVRAREARLAALEQESAVA